MRRGPYLAYEVGSRPPGSQVQSPATTAGSLFSGGCTKTETLGVHIK